MISVPLIYIISFTKKTICITKIIPKALSFSKKQHSESISLLKEKIMPNDKNIKTELPRNPELTPPCGPVKGQYRKGISSYKGIPYAMPPLRERRFKAPEPMPPWEDLRDCQKPGHTAMQ